MDTAKRGIDFKMSNTLPRVSFAVLCSHQLTSNPSPPPHTPLTGTPGEANKNNQPILFRYVYLPERNELPVLEIGILLVGGTLVIRQHLGYKFVSYSPDVK